ncbi:uncharacterized protein BO87DRAFT_449880, partial [Aspergillus neoniger CBS 115656]
IVVVHDLEGPEFACEEGSGELMAWFEDVLIADYPEAHILSFCPIPGAFSETLLTGRGFQTQAWELLSSIQQQREDDHVTHDLLYSDTTYQSWRNNGNAGVFYVYGGGKMETAQFTKISAEETMVTAYLSFEDVPCFERTLSTVIRVLIYRFLVTVAPAFDIIRPVLRSFGQIPNYTVEELWVLLGSLLSCPEVQSIYYIIDGVDLCNDSITDQLDALVEMAHARSICCKVLATSRTLSNAASGKTPALNLNSLLLQHENLKDLVRRTMRQLLTQTRSLTDLEQVIVNELQGSASPSDINIRLQALLHFARPLSVCSIEGSLQILQKPLSELYARMLGPLNALRPWLAIAVLIPDSLEEQELLRQLPLDLEGDLARALGPLIEIRNGQPMFASESVREYIRREGTAKLKLGTGAQACDLLSHVDLTRHCLTYLKRSLVTQASPTDECYSFLGQSGMEFSEYAARYWPYHYRAEENRDALTYDIIDFFLHDNCGKRWAEWWRNVHCFDSTDSIESTPLALAAEHGLCEVVSKLIYPTEGKSISSQEMTEALEVALQFGHLDVARQLLLDTTPSNKSLTLASRTGATELVIDILTKLDVPESVCLKSLQVAVIRGHLETIDILLQLLPDLSSALQDNTYLYLDTIYSGQFQVLKHLLNVGGARLPGEVGSSLLRLAAQRGDIDVIRLLL